MLDESEVRRRATHMIEDGGFLGVPQETFELAGRSHFIRLLQQGLLPESKVLEIGCRCLRIGYWLIRFLNSRGYAGFDPARNRIELGMVHLFDQEELFVRKPRFDFNEDFDTSVFNEPFDYFLACSIWTRCSKSHIQVMLDGYVKNATDNGAFIASYLSPLNSADDYFGDHWVGTSHKSANPGIVRHSLDWIVAECDKRNLRLAALEGLDCDSSIG